MKSKDGKQKPTSSSALTAVQERKIVKDIKGWKYGIKGSYSNNCKMGVPYMREVGSSEEGLSRGASQDPSRVSAQIQTLLVVPDRGRKVSVVGSATVSDFPVRTLF